jgi:hypothetical protein
MYFCETNRIGFALKIGDNILRWNWMRSKKVKKSIRFVLRGNGKRRGDTRTTAEGG